MNKRSKDIDRIKKSLHGYSRWIKFLRKLLPLVSLVLILSIIVWPIYKEFFEPPLNNSLPTPKKMTLENYLINPTLVGTNEKDRPYSLAAESSVQTKSDQSELVKPRGTIKTNEDVGFEITSDHGQYNQEKDIVTYEKNVTLTTSDGYVFKTSKAQIHLKTQVAEGSDPIKGLGPAGQIEARDGFVIDKSKNTLLFKGKTKLILNDNKKNKS